MSLVLHDKQKLLQLKNLHFKTASFYPQDLFTAWMYRDFNPLKKTSIEQSIRKSTGYNLPSEREESPEASWALLHKEQGSLT